MRVSFSLPGPGHYLRYYKENTDTFGSVTWLNWKSQLHIEVPTSPQHPLQPGDPLTLTNQYASCS